VATRGWAADALNPRARRAAEDGRLTQEIQLLREELRIKDACVAKIDPRHRPYYPGLFAVGPADRRRVADDSCPAARVARRARATMKKVHGLQVRGKENIGRQGRLARTGWNL